MRLSLLAPSRVSFVLLDRPPTGFGLGYAQAFTLASTGHVELLTPSTHPDVGPDGFSRAYDRVWYQRTRHERWNVEGIGARVHPAGSSAPRSRPDVTAKDCSAQFTDEAPLE